MKFVPNVVTRSVARTALLSGKHSPTILFGAGVVGIIGTVVLASRATLKVEDVLVKAQAQLETIDRNTGTDIRYTDQDALKDKTLVFLKTGVELGTLYGPAIIVGVVSIGCLTSSHRILTKRNAALTAAYASLEKAYNSYRDRVAEVYGRDAEAEIYAPTETVTEIDPANGKEVQVKRAKGINSPYARVFDEFSANWQKTQEYNQIFIQCQQGYANDLLKARGHVFLNEVYDMLGLDRSKEGAVVGWVLGNGDDYIDFGVFEGDIFNAMRFVKGDERSVWLDFNVDGLIYDKI